MDEFAGKLLSWDQAPGVAADLRDAGKVIVTTNGSFDIMHVGHVRYLREAAKQGDVLIVGLNSDRSIKQYKGPRRPINSQEHRAELLLAMRFVSYVVIFDDTTPLKFIELISPNIHVNGQEYGRDCIEAPLLDKLGAELHLVPRWDGLSTAALIEHVIDAYKDQ